MSDAGKTGTTESVNLHLVTVGADAGETARTEKLCAIVNPLSHRFCAELDELNSADHPKDAVTMVRLFGRSTTHALTWIGAKGRVGTEVAIIGVAEGLIFEAKPQPPRAFGVMPKALVSAIASQKIAFDTGAAAFLIGATDEAKSMAASVSRLGFKRIRIVDTDDRKTEQLTQYLRRRLFGVEIEAVSRRLLTQVPNESSLAISMVGTSQASLLEDVSYLNFLKKSGVWIDWTGATVELGFHAEIADAGARMFDANIVRGWRDAWLLNSLDQVATSTSPKPDILARALSRAWNLDAESTNSP